MKFEFYVLNWNINKKQVENFNIFNNAPLSNRIEKEVKKYLRGPSLYKYIKYGFGEPDTVISGFEGFCEELRTSIMWQEWARCEYEIAVGDLFEKDVDKFEKWDCYKQALPNIEIIAREVIYQAKKQMKKEKENRKV